MPSSSSSVDMLHCSNDMLPFRCPSCRNGKRFRSLIALRLHTSIVHDIQVPNLSSSQTTEKQFSVNENLSEGGKSLDVLHEKSSTNNDNPGLAIDFTDLLSSTPVDDMFNKYSAKIDQVMKRYDSQSKKLENKLKLTKQLDEVRKQRQELHRLSKAWRVAHGMSQLVHDTDVIINKNLSDGFSASENSKPKNEEARLKVSKSQHGPENETNVEKQLDLSIQLAAQYKALALNAEEKLNEKLREEQHMKQYLEATAHKEQEARNKLADFMEELVQRAEYAESKLQVYQGLTDGYSDPKQVGYMRSKPTFQNSNAVQHKRDPANIFKSPYDGPLSRLSDSGISVSQRTRADNEIRDKRKHGDPYVDDILERPSSADTSTKRKKSSKKQLKGLSTTELVDTTKVMPFSNWIGGNKNSDQAADRRVALFCVFTQLRTVDLLRCSLVCREWRDTARHHQLWSRIRFHDVDINPKLFRLVSNWSKETCFLCLKNIGLLTHDTATPGAGKLEEGVEMILKSCAGKLLVLSIDQCDPFITSRLLWLVSCYNKNICSISYRSSLDPVSHQVAWALGSSCRNIVSLEVAPLHPCSVRGLFTNNVARLLSWCWPHLQALSFGGQDIDGAGLLAVALNCHHLKVLELDHARGVTQDQALTVCKHGLKELHTLLFTHTPILPSTLLHFLKSLNLKSVYVIVSQRDYFTRSKSKRIGADYAKISRALMNIQKKPAYQRVLSVECS